MRFILMCLIFILFLSVNYSCQIQKQSDINVLSYKSIFKYSFLNDSVSQEVDSVRIIYFKRNIIYQIPNIQYALKSSKIVDDTIRNELAESDTTFNYYVTLEGESTGIMYSSLTGENPEKFTVDSFLIDKGLNQENRKILEMDLGKPISTKKNRNITIETFAPFKLEANDVDTVYRYYDKNFVDIDFSFSKKIDHEMKAKYVKAHVVTLYENRNNERNTPIREDVIQELEIIKLKYESRIPILLKRFREDSILLNVK